MPNLVTTENIHHRLLLTLCPNYTYAQSICLTLKCVNAISEFQKKEQERITLNQLYQQH